MNNMVQGIIIKENKVLMIQGVGENRRRDNFFISGETMEGESAVDAIKREIREQLNLDIEVTFKFHKEIGNHINTFLIELEDKDIALDYDIEKVKCYDKYYRPIEIKWVELKESNSFREFETQYIRLLLEEYMRNGYNSKAIEVISDTYFSSKAGKSYLKTLVLENERKLIDSKETLGNKMIAIFMAIGLGVLFDYFFTGDYLGISAFIFTMAIIIFTIYEVYSKVKLKKKLGIMFIIPIILLSLSFAIYNNPVLRGLNVMLIPILISSYLITVRYDNVKEISPALIVNVFDRIFIKALSTFPRFFNFSIEVSKNRKKLEGNSTRKNIIRGILISIPLLIIILILLSSADMMFKHYIENIGSVFGTFSIANSLGHIIVISVITLYMFGFLWSFKYNGVQYSDEDIDFIKASWEPVTIITILVTINIAYLLFTIVQLSYLYGGGMNALPEGFSYAEYARRGFFELILVTIMNFVILILSMNLTKKDNGKTNNIVNISYSFLIIFTFNMLVSASYKMHLYEKAFGFTRLRIFVQAFMVLIGILLIIVLLGIWVKRVPIFKYSFMATLIVYVVLNFINVDSIIAKENILRYEETGKIDIHYIKGLSYDAIPEVEKLLNVKEAYIKDEIVTYLNIQKGRLDKKYDHWYEYNYYKSKLLKANY